MALENLKLLEAKLGDFLSRHAKVRIENSELLVQINSQEREHTLLRKRVERYETERREMKIRLDRILIQFNRLGVGPKE